MYFMVSNVLLDGLLMRLMMSRSNLLPCLFSQLSYAPFINDTILTSVLPCLVVYDVRG